MSGLTPMDGVWTTYTEAAARLGVTVEAVRRRATRSGEREISEKSPFAAGFHKLRSEPPKGVDNPRYVEVLADAEAFLGRWGAQAEAMGWRRTTCSGFILSPPWPAMT
jgi:hypothetical protein